MVDQKSEVRAELADKMDLTDELVKQINAWINEFGTQY